MSDETTPPAGVVEDVAEPPAGAAESEPATEPEQPATVSAPVAEAPVAEDDENAPISRARARELNREHQQLRREIEAAHAAREAAEQKLAEALSIAEKATSLEDQLRVERVRGAVLSQAPSLGFMNAEDALLFIRDKVVVDEIGGSNARELLSDLAKEKPYLVNTPRSMAAGAVTNPGRVSEPNSVAELDGLSPSEVIRHLSRMSGRR